VILSWQNAQTFFLGLRSGGLAIVVLLIRAPHHAGMVGYWVRGVAPRG
jgi:hypothetical protein